MGRRVMTMDEIEGNTPRRSMRISNEDWDALGAYAAEHGDTRTGVVTAWIREECRDFYAATDEQIDGQQSPDPA